VVGTLLPLAQNLEQMALGVGFLPLSQLLGVKGVEQILLDAPVAIDGAKARRDHKSECSRLEVLKVRERARRARERECCLLVLNSVTSTPQWIRQPEAAWGWWKLSRTGDDTSPRCAHAHKTQSQLNLSQLNLSQTLEL